MFSYLAIVAALALSNVDAFVMPTTTSAAPKTTVSLRLWKDEFSIPPPVVSTDSMQTRVQQCLSTSDIPQMTLLLQELEELENDCTEEGNQTEDECDVILKETRQTWMKELQDKISLVSAETMVMMFMTSTQNQAIEDQVRASLDQALTNKELQDLITKLEDKIYDCTEEGNQTNDECDIAAKAERDFLLKQLEAKLCSNSQIQYCLDHPTGIALREWTTMWNALEAQECACTEEGNQTNEECDVTLKAHRQELLELISQQILKSQGHQAKQTQLCMEYSLCDISSLKKTLDDLEEVDNLCTEEGNQTRSFCSIHAKQQREETMEQLRTEIELAENVVNKQRPGQKKDVSVFQI